MSQYRPRVRPTDDTGVYTRRSEVMKFMLIMNTPRDGYDQYMKWPRKILEANTAFMRTFTG